ncbi:hypothetical protein PVK06_008638 [Gossypium arboreum]|uniref:DUF7745 domain-containing protein n=1 Tax=Gossypium arboreum TaxID=29729 RepID=A0ABR0QLS7_GOSAR|nr:hypothetical protein PVK06_008638 [Gossypium arboreum]
MALLNCPKIQADRAYSRPVNVSPFLKKLMNITGMSEQWVAARIKQKGDSKCILWKNLRDLILGHPDMKKRVDVFALSLYGLIVFPKELGHVDKAVSDLFDRLDKGTTPVLAILAETFRSLNACQSVGEGRFVGCAQLLLAWFHSHFWKVEKVFYRIFSKDYSLLRELRHLRRKMDSYSPELSRQFIAATQGLAQCEFSYKDNNYKKKVREISDAWNQTRRMKGFTMGPMTTSEYEWWWGRRVNDNILRLDQENTRLIEEHLRVIPSELEIIKQDFEKKSSELGKKIKQLKEEKMRLGLDLEVQKLRKGKNKAEEDLDSLKTDYKKLRMSIRTAGLGKMSEQWCQEIEKEKTRADHWEKKFQDVRVREDALKKSLLESQSEKESRNSRIELKTSLSKIGELKEEIGKLDTALQDSKIRVKLLEANNEHYKEQLLRSQDQI